MSAALGAARFVVVLFGITMVAAGLATMALAGAAAAVTGVWLVGLGLVCIVGALIERIRYRSDATDRTGLPAGPAGGEPPGTRLETRFQRSDETFVDPTSGHRIRVWSDPSSGERRYVSED